MPDKDPLMAEYRAMRDKCEVALFAFKHRGKQLDAAPGELKRYFDLRQQLFGDAGPIGLVRDYANKRTLAAEAETTPYPR